MWFLLAILPDRDVTQTNVDVVEVNHHYDDTGHNIYNQLIFWAWHPQECTHHVRESRTIPEDRTFAPVKYNGRWQFQVMDFDTLRNVRAITFRHSWTQGSGNDPETHDAGMFPREERASLP
jgi:hypothetical protein